MKCAWKALVSILPPWLGREIDPRYRDKLQELRLRLGNPPELLCSDGSTLLTQAVRDEDIHFCVNTASRYSPWAAQSVARGFLTAPGGHRIGICGEGIVKSGQITGIRNISSLCIRICRDFPGIGMAAADLKGSILILGSPGWGKTTLLRDFIRQKAKASQVSVVDARGELFPEQAGFEQGARVDVLRGCDKANGIERLLRVMGPQINAVDEITAARDCEAMLQAGRCGVSLMATAHASSLDDYLHRPLYRPLADTALFDHIIVLRRDKSWILERVDKRCYAGSARY